MDTASQWTHTPVLGEALYGFKAENFRNEREAMTEALSVSLSWSLAIVDSSQTASQDFFCPSNSEDVQKTPAAVSALLHVCRWMKKKRGPLG